MRICFEWEKISNKTIIKRYSVGSIAAQIIDESSNCYGCALYGIANNGAWHRFDSLEDAKEYCDKVLEENGVKTVGEEYKVLI